MHQSAFEWVDTGKDRVALHHSELRQTNWFLGSSVFTLGALIASGYFFEIVFGGTSTVDGIFLFMFFSTIAIVTFTSLNWIIGRDKCQDIFAPYIELQTRSIMEGLCIESIWNQPFKLRQEIYSVNVDGDDFEKIAEARLLAEEAGRQWQTEWLEQVEKFQLQRGWEDTKTITS